jgi:diguanylate cyclase (GGDEF)-like protein/PAS domain S-box-containing protein
MLLRTLAAKTLRHAGFEVIDAADGEGALAKLAERPFDLILLDIMMPGLDGYEVCRRIRAMPQGARVPILILTGLADTASIELAYSQGATDFITKPINWALLSHRVRYALRAGTAAEAIERSRESLARAQHLAGMGNWAMLADGRLECSAELLRLFGSTTAELDLCSSADTFIERVVPADRERVRRARAQLSEVGAPYQLEFQIERFDGAVRTVIEQGAPIPNDQGRPLRIEGIIQDITERVQAQERIRALAQYDGATGLPNRQCFAELAAPSLMYAARTGRSCTLMHVDVDRFKGIDDAFGRRQGDGVLKTLAERLRSWLRSSGLVSAGQAGAEHGVLASAGGNTFTLLVADLPSQEQATAVALALHESIGQPIIVETRSVILSASIGIAFFPHDAQDFEGLSRCAEQAGRAAQSAGRSQHRFFDERMNASAADRLALENDLRQAIAQHELRLHFQPKVDATTGAVVGAEALIRWQHPERGAVPPREIIALAEQGGLILPLTDWVLESACRNLREWLDAGLPGVPLSVDLATAYLTGARLPGKLAALMQRFRLEPSSLMLAMTDTMLMCDVESSVAMLHTLRATGYGLALGSFGTGNSSLSRLQRLPIDELIIDREFVIDTGRGGRCGAPAASLIAFGREQGLNVVAQGVETAEQSAFLLQRGCPIQQGDWFSRALPAAPFVRLLRRGSVTPHGVCPTVQTPPLSLPTVPGVSAQVRRWTRLP